MSKLRQSITFYGVVASIFAIVYFTVVGYIVG